MTDPTVNAVILFAVVAIALGALAFLAGALRLLETMFPAFSRWLDEHVGEAQPWERPW